MRIKIPATFECSVPQGATHYEVRQVARNLYEFVFLRAAVSGGWSVGTPWGWAPSREQFHNARPISPLAGT